MKILVDYDNVGDSLRRRSLVDLADKVLSRVPMAHMQGRSAMSFRLYAGWDKGGRLTQEAQRLSSELRSSFPKIWNLPHSINVTMELAQSTEAFPQKVLSHTFRNEPIRTINFQRPTATTCRNTACPIEPLFDFFTYKRCPEARCSATPANLGSQDMQKMVDTMLVADLLYLAHAGAETICLVCHDDDMWPGILGAIAIGATIIHIQPHFNGYSISKYLPQNVIAYKGVAL